MENQPPLPRRMTSHKIFRILLIFVTLPTIFYMWKFESSISEHSNKDYEPVYRSELERALAEAATEGKTLIITFLSKAEVEKKVEKPLFDMFFDAFWQGEDTQEIMNHLLIAAVDEMAYRRCKLYWRHCYMLDSRKPEAFVNRRWERTLFLAKVLALGYNFIFTDIDVIWLRNPFPILLHSQRPNEAMDLQISVDKFNGNQSSEKNLINTGFYMVRSNYKTVLLFYDWHFKINQKSGTTEQDALRMLMKEGHFRKLGLKVTFLDTLYFSGFCEGSKDVRLVATVHANCCQDMKAKVKDLNTVINDWKRFRSSPDAPFKWSKNKYCKASRQEHLL